jgi:hypothetical protein
MKSLKEVERSEFKVTRAILPLRPAFAARWTAAALVAVGLTLPAVADQFQRITFDSGPDAPSTEQVTFATAEIANATGSLFYTAGARTGQFGQRIHVNRYAQNGAWLQNAEWAIGTGPTASRALSMLVQPPANRLVFAGETNGAGVSLGVFVLRSDASFNLDPTFAYAYTASASVDNRPVVSIRQNTDGTMVFTARRLVGATLRGVLNRIDPNGLPIFFRNYLDPSAPNSCWVSFSDVRRVSDGYVVVGYAAVASTAPKSTLLLKTDLGGNFVWARLFQPPTGLALESTGEALDVLTDDSIVFVSRLETGGTVIASQFVRTDPLGNPLWFRNYFEFLAAHAALQIDQCGQIACAGVFQTTSPPAPDTSALVFLRLSGAPIRNMAYGTGSPEFFRGKALAVTRDGGYLVAGDHLRTAADLRDIHMAKSNPVAYTGCFEIDRAVQISAQPSTVLQRDLTFTIDGDFVTIVPQRDIIPNDQRILCTRCVGDIDGLGTVDLPDLTALLASFGTCEGSALFNPMAKFANDCSPCIGLNDLTVFLGQFGLVCP